MDAKTAIFAAVFLLAIEVGFGLSKLQSKLDQIIGQLENANDTLASLLTLAESAQESTDPDPFHETD